MNEKMEFVNSAIADNLVDAFGASMSPHSSPMDVNFYVTNAIRLIRENPTSIFSFSVGTLNEKGEETDETYVDFYFKLGRVKRVMTFPIDDGFDKSEFTAASDIQYKRARAAHGYQAAVLGLIEYFNLWE